MSNYGNYLKEKSKRDKDFFFGEGNWRKVTNKYLMYKSVIDNDNIIIRTNNVKIIKECFVLIVANNKAVYLKDWQVKKFSNWRYGIDSHLIKLSRQYFKVYEFKSNFDWISIEGEYDFDYLLELAKSQEGQLEVKV